MFLGASYSTDSEKVTASTLSLLLFLYYSYFKYFFLIITVGIVFMHTSYIWKDHFLTAWLEGESRPYFFTSKVYGPPPSLLPPATRRGCLPPSGTTPCITCALESFFFSHLLSCSFWLSPVSSELPTSTFYYGMLIGIQRL